MSRYSREHYNCQVAGIGGVVVAVLGKGRYLEALVVIPPLVSPFIVVLDQFLKVQNLRRQFRHDIT